jgi:hypothetical protein
MRLRTLLALGAVGAAAAALLLSTGALARPLTGPRAATASRSHLQVTEVEYRLLLSRGVVRAGPLDLEALDRGMDPHDLHLRPTGSGAQTAVPELTPGGRWDGVVNLKPGTYYLWCSLPEHARLGMHATLRVVR